MIEPVSYARAHQFSSKRISTKIYLSHNYQFSPFLYVLSCFEIYATCSCTREHACGLYRTKVNLWQIKHLSSAAALSMQQRNQGKNHKVLHGAISVCADGEKKKKKRKKKKTKDDDSQKQELGYDEVDQNKEH